MLKYTNEIIEKDVKEKGWILININGVGKSAILTLWCGEDGHKYQTTTYANLIYKNGFKCKDCIKDKYINMFCRKLKNIELNLIEIIEYKSYDYRKTLLLVSCGKHNPFEVRGKQVEREVCYCKECRKEENIKKIRKEFSEKKLEVLDIKYNEKDYTMSKVKVRCKNNCHKPFTTSLNKLRYSLPKCKDCEKERKILIMKNEVEKRNFIFYGVEKFIQEDYIKSIIKVGCKTNKSHIFKIRFSNFKYDNRGCPLCNESKGEQRIEEILIENNIKYVYQYKFKNCKFKQQLPFDFYLPQYDILIEFDGEQHYQIIEYFGGLDGFIDRKIRDTIKNIYCQQNNIKLIRIPYWDFDNIEDILIKELNL